MSVLVTTDRIDPSDNGAETGRPLKVLLTVDEAATALSLGRTITYSLVMRDEILSVKIGRRRLIPVAALYAYVERLSTL
jgi:excisionase family DNA binding protein